MTFDQLDPAIRAGAIVTTMLLAWLLFRDRRRVGLPAALFAPLALCLAGFVVGNTAFAASRPAGVLGEAAHLGSGFTVVFLWWFCLSCFDRRFRVDGIVLGTSIAWAVIAAADRGIFGAPLARAGLSWLLVAIGFAIVGHLVWRLLADRAGDLIERRHEARIVAAASLGAMLAIDLAADVLMGSNGVPGGSRWRRTRRSSSMRCGWQGGCCRRGKTSSPFGKAKGHRPSRRGRSILSCGSGW